MSVVLKQRFNADPKQLRLVREAVQSTLEKINCSKKVTHDLIIAINEACMNIIQHAYDGDPTGEIELEIINNGGELEIFLRDFAALIDPAQVRPRDLNEVRPGGLGTHFIRELMDDCVYGHREDKTGNVLRMRKTIS